jgi:diaminopimelate epimerase
VPGIPFFKYSAYGNTFVVLDELSDASFEDLQKSSFASNLLVVQHCSDEVLSAIQLARAYWQHGLPSFDSERPAYVFRMFEPDGQEALCCGNGLLCIAKHLHHVHGLSRARLLTEVPAALPVVREIGTLDDGAPFEHEVRIGVPHAIPDSLMHAQAEQSRDGAVSRLWPIPLDGAFTRDAPSGMRLECHGTYTGEPHLVIVDRGEQEPALRWLYDRVMGPGEGRAAALDTVLLEELGRYVQRTCQAWFPRGVNISFARVRADEGLVEYRCFERGIYKETLACGTAAVAIFVVLQQLGLVPDGSLTLRPKLGSEHPLYARALIQVERDQQGSYWLRGQARRIFEATLRSSEYPGVLGDVPGRKARP